ncbi:MAG: tryptophan 7-halogenase [Gammaproteobacteria bacterium]|nr:tryptophan 7-halogenase [Gammaproteobacteria bacterium]
MNTMIKKVVVVGGGTAGWMSAALMQRVLGKQVTIELVESDAIGIVGVGEATIPPIQQVNAVLGIDEAEFLRATKATIKLAIKFDNWRVPGESYYHTFGVPGRNHAFCDFHHYWRRAEQLGLHSNLWDYDLNYLCCEQGVFAKLQVKDPIWDVPYAYHFDSGLYGQFLRKISEANGVKRTEGMIDNVSIDPDSGFVTSLLLRDGRQVEGDFFIDCSGFRGLLIQKFLGTGYEDWSHWLPCDKAIAVPSERFEKTLPYTRSIAHSAGWQWRIPLQHRNGNGLVYSSNHYSDDEAASILLANLDSPALGEPKMIPFRTGRARKQWHRNVCAVGLASGFLEPLESTSIYLVQSAIVRLIKLFPHQGVSDKLVTEYNEQARIEYETIRDFIILHYHVNERNDSQFWRDLRNMDVPPRLSDKIDLFRASGLLFQDQLDIFKDASWLQVMLGQGIMPEDYHPLADEPGEQQLQEMLAKMAASKRQPLAKLPQHDEFLRMFCEAGR